MRRAFGIWMSVALCRGRARGNPDVPRLPREQVEPQVEPSDPSGPAVGRDSLECSRNQLLDSRRSGCNARESGFFTPITSSPFSLRTAERHRTPAGIALSRCD
jgi:hypothetical protein